MKTGLLAAGTLLIILTPLWWFFGAGIITQMLCNPEDYSVTSGHHAYFACTAVYVKAAFFGSLGNFITGGLLMYFAGKIQRKQGKLKRRA